MKLVQLFGFITKKNSMKFIIVEKTRTAKKGRLCAVSSLVRTKNSALFAIIRCCHVGESIRQQFNELSSPASSCLFVCLFVCLPFPIHPFRTLEVRAALK